MHTLLWEKWDLVIEVIELAYKDYALIIARFFLFFNKLSQIKILGK